MSYPNPTPIRIGMTGNLAGKHYRVVGRVVLGEEEAGETYYWNEFNLESDGGDVATLVYEETEQGGEWRLFHLFEPDHPMTAADAATKRLGDPLNLDGTPMFVRLRVQIARLCTSKAKRRKGSRSATWRITSTLSPATT